MNNQQREILYDLVQQETNKVFNKIKESSFFSFDNFVEEDCYSSIENIKNMLNDLQVLLGISQQLQVDYRKENEFMSLTQDEFNILQKHGKIEAIKALRQRTGASLIQCKKYVDETCQEHDI